MIYAENILICFAIPLLLLLFVLRGKTRLFVGVFLTGMGVCLLAAYISSFLGAVSGMGADDTAVYLSPIIEELMKCLPLFFIFFLFGLEEESVLLCAVGIGAGFSLFENCCYMLTFGTESLSFVMIRSLVVGVMHIVSMMVLAICLNMAVRMKALSFSSIIGAVSLSMTFHGLYNLLVSKPGITSWIGNALPVATALFLYLLFHRLRDGTVG